MDILKQCYIIQGKRTIPLLEWIERRYDVDSYHELAVSKIDHIEGLYGLYIMFPGEPMGIIKDIETSTELMCIELPKHKVPITYLIFNKK